MYMIMRKKCMIAEASKHYEQPYHKSDQSETQMTKLSFFELELYKTNLRKIKKYYELSLSV